MYQGIAFPAIRVKFASPTHKLVEWLPSHGTFRRPLT
jgi:hypothetical protein